MKKHSQKVKLLKLWDILRMETSPEYPMSSVELLSRLEDLGIDCDRKTLYKDIEELNKFGYIIKTIKKKRNLYYVDTDVFSMAELKILADSVAYASFIPADKAKALIEKISVLGNEEWVDQLLETDTDIVNRATNNEIYENIIILNNAIAKRKKITFKYFDYDFNLTVTYRKKGERYKLNPIKLVSSNNKYYLVGYDDKHQEYTNYRIDRMHDVKEAVSFISIYEGLDEKKLKEHITQSFSMFSGEDRRVFLRFHKSITNEMIDRFGPTMKYREIEGEYANISAQTNVSNQFFAWLAALHDLVVLTKPSDIVLEYRDFLKNALDKTNEADMFHKKQDIEEEKQLEELGQSEQQTNKDESEE